ncbi:hypothetical protein CEXT_690101 [Caerostris extrusa]|uniref:Uncharacterized protein n=1 Tax=Caerostris extrusa TaxID=172846 RepID=A0AAV4QBF9_CAEEX|nr:hypothetical protein CEXT_690101 [Caerostris extrusa]
MQTISLTAKCFLEHSFVRFNCRQNGEPSIAYEETEFKKATGKNRLALLVCAMTPCILLKMDNQIPLAMIGSSRNINCDEFLDCDVCKRQ